MLILLIAVLLDFFEIFLKLYCLFDPAQICFDCARPIYRLCSTYVSIVLDLCFDCAWPVFCFSWPFGFSRPLFWTSLTTFFFALCFDFLDRNQVCFDFLDLCFEDLDKSRVCFNFLKKFLACSDFLDPPKKYIFDLARLMFQISRTKLDMFQILGHFRLAIRREIVFLTTKRNEQQIFQTFCENLRLYKIHFHFRKNRFFLDVYTNYCSSPLKLYWLFDPGQICFDCARPIYRLYSTYVLTVLDRYFDSARLCFGCAGLCLDCARPIFLLCSTYNSTALGLCFDCARQIFRLSQPESGTFWLCARLKIASRPRTFSENCTCSTFKVEIWVEHLDLSANCLCLGAKLANQSS